MIKVCHLTTVHPWNDTRILYKECISFSRAGYDVTLLVPHSRNESVEKVKVVNIPEHSGSRLKRATLTAFRLYREAVKQKSDIYHFHDPELIWVGILLKLSGKKVVFDIHENIREQIKTKQWLPLRGLISWTYSLVDWVAAKLFSLVLAERSYEPLYKKYTTKYQVVQNMPDIGLLKEYFIEDRSKLLNNVFYLGNVTFDRCIDTIAKALIIASKSIPDITFHCVGDCDPVAIQSLSKIDGYSSIQGRIHFYGSMPAVKAYALSTNCKAGLSILKPTGNYLHSYSTKIFEYMCVGLPVITSNFKLYTDVVERTQCGLCVDPLSPDKIAEAIIYTLTRPEVKQMGINGRHAVETEYNWAAEEKKLLNFYKKL